jgi:hypothetical protein
MGFQEYAITMNIYPKAVDKVIEKEERHIQRLQIDAASERKQSLATDLEAKQDKVTELQQGKVIPLGCLYVVRLWHRSADVLSARCASLRNAFTAMGGAIAHHATIPENARQLFYQTWPGWTYGRYRAFDLPAEDAYLADLIPWSATFTGHLKDAEAIYNGARGNLVGIRTRIGNTPQHGVLFGMTGAGKSVIVSDLLAQIRHAMIVESLQQLYTDSFTDWSVANEGAAEELRWLACAIDKYLRTRMKGSHFGFDDAFAAFRDWQQRNPDEANSFVEELGEQTVTEFAKNRATERLVRDLAFAGLSSGQFPTHSALVEQLLYNPRGGAREKEESDRVGKLLRGWSRDGEKGCLFDGVSNIRIDGRVAHFELGQIPEHAVELKAAANFLVANYGRQKIISMPRSVPKIAIFEEAARTLDIPGGTKMIQEYYRQMRKFGCNILAVVQQYDIIKDSAVRGAMIGNSKMLLPVNCFMRPRATTRRSINARQRFLSTATLSAGSLKNQEPSLVPRKNLQLSQSYEASWSVNQSHSSWLYCRPYSAERPTNDAGKRFRSVNQPGRSIDGSRGRRARGADRFCQRLRERHF